MLPDIATVSHAQTDLNLPSFPSEISADTSLSDLKAIRAFWAKKARELEYPEKAYKVTSWFGKVIETRPTGRIHKIWSQGNVYSFAREYTERYVPSKATNLIVCCLAVYVGHPDLTRKNLVDQIVLSENMVRVVSWRWDVIGDEISEKEDNYFIPGRWFDVFAAADADARGEIAHSAAEQDEMERKRLLDELLVGREV